MGRGGEKAKAAWVRKKAERSFMLEEVCGKTGYFSQG